jgi:hypothetical protein
MLAVDQDAVLVEHDRVDRLAGPTARNPGHHGSVPRAVGGDNIGRLPRRYEGAGPNRPLQT